MKKVNVMDNMKIFLINIFSFVEPIISIIMPYIYKQQYGKMNLETTHI